ncbi:MAG: SDR family oxidoreductase [Burkholderiales bacterium]|nr:SDR family oxidoreductase [Burkholderiales bacterium]
MADLKDKLALVTGGARGLGQATAVELARCGARVAVADRKTEAAEETAALCAQHTAGAQAFTYDQSKAESVQACIGEVVAAFGGIDLLFANAGTGRFAPIADMKKADWDLLIQINLNGTFYVCQDVVRQMIKQGRGGKIVLTASSGATVMCDQLGAYCASKAGVFMLMKHMASELGNYRINVNAIQPGVVATGMTGPMLADDRIKRMLVRQTPVGRWGEPRDVAKLVAFLLSDDAGYINGEGIMIDGGSTLHGYPRWYSLDYTNANECDWQALFDEYPYKG